MVDATIIRQDFYVYVIFRPNGIPCYVGKGRGKRWRQHARRATNPHLAAIYIAANNVLPILKIREGLSNDEASAIEIAFIAAIGRECHGGPLINLTDGGEGVPGHRPSLRAREQARKSLAEIRGRPDHGMKISAALTGRKRSAEECAAISNGSKGKIINAEHRVKISLTLSGSHLTEEHVANISKSLKGRIFTEEHKSNMRRPCREETKIKLSIAKTGVKASEAHRAALVKGWERDRATRKGPVISDEGRARLSALRTGVPLSDSHRASIGAGWEKRKKRQIEDWVMRNAEKCS